MKTDQIKDELQERSDQIKVIRSTLCAPTLRESIQLYYYIPGTWHIIILYFLNVFKLITEARCSNGKQTDLGESKETTAKTMTVSFERHHLRMICNIEKYRNKIKQK